MYWGIAVACIPLAACGRGDHRRGWDWERMRQQPRYDVYEASRFFADSAVMQSPPAGTIAREQLVGQPLVAEGEEGGREATVIPVPVTPALLSLGQSRFQIFCAVCHGAGGYGGSIVAANMLPPHPPSLRSPATRALPPGRVFRVITQGFGRMPSYATQLSVEERWAVIAYLQRLQQSDRAGSPEARDDSARAVRLQARYADSASRGNAGARPPTTDEAHR